MSYSHLKDVKRVNKIMTYMLLRTLNQVKLSVGLMPIGKGWYLNWWQSSRLLWLTIKRQSQLSLKHCVNLKVHILSVQVFFKVWNYTVSSYSKRLLDVWLLFTLKMALNALKPLSTQSLFLWFDILFQKNGCGTEDRRRQMVAVDSVWIHSHYPRHADRVCQCDLCSGPSPVNTWLWTQCLSVHHSIHHKLCRHKDTRYSSDSRAKYTWMAVSSNNNECHLQCSLFWWCSNDSTISHGCHHERF